MRMRFGVAMPPKGGRSAIIGVEVLEGRNSKGNLEHTFIVGFVDRVTPFTVEAARDRVAELAKATQDQLPCVLIDTGTPQGMALRQALKVTMPDGLHRPHMFAGTGDRVQLFAQFLQAYSTGRVLFRPGLKYRADLDRALVFYLGGSKKDGDRKMDGVELSSEDEAMVVALGLALFWPRHGGKANPVVVTQPKPA